MAYLTHVFGNTDVEITEDERIILVEPEFLHGLLPLLIATPERVQGKYIFHLLQKKTFSRKTANLASNVTLTPFWSHHLLISTT